MTNKWPMFPPSFPPWKGPRVFESGGYHSSTSNEIALLEKLGPYLPDEQKAFTDYTELADWAELIGRPDISAYLRSMAWDEHRHALSIKAMMKDLRGGYK